MHALMHTHTNALVHVFTYACARTHSLTHKPTRARMHALARSLALTHVHTLARTGRMHGIELTGVGE